METTKVMTLLTPVKLGDIEYNEISLREPTAGDMEAAQNAGPNGMTSNMTLISRVAAVPMAAVRLMGARDHQAAMAFLLPFMTTAPATGD